MTAERETRLTPAEKIAQDVKDLVEPGRTVHVFTKTEARLHGRTTHKQLHPSLLDQLRHGLEPGADSDAAMSGSYESRPALRSDTLAALLRIEAGSVWWMRRLGLGMRPTCEANLRALVGAATVASPTDLREIAADVKRWWRLARTLTGWDSQPWRPDVVCPLCNRRGGLAVKLEAKTAVCTKCQETWGPDTIGLLADYVRGATDGAGDRGATHVTGGAA